MMPNNLLHMGLSGVILASTLALSMCSGGEDVQGSSGLTSPGNSQAQPEPPSADDGSKRDFGDYDQILRDKYANRGEALAEEDAEGAIRDVIKASSEDFRIKIDGREVYVPEPLITCTLLADGSMTANLTSENLVSTSYGGIALSGAEPRRNMWVSVYAGNGTPFEFYGYAPDDFPPSQRGATFSFAGTAENLTKDKRAEIELSINCPQP